MHITAEERRSKLWLAALDWLSECDWHFRTQRRPRPLQTHWPMTDLSTALLFSLFGVTERERDSFNAAKLWVSLSLLWESNSWFIMWESRLPRQVSKTLCCLLFLALFQTCIPARRVKESEHLNISSNSYGCMCLCVIVKCESLSGADMSWLLSHTSVRGFCIRGGMCDQCTREESQLGFAQAPKSLSCFFQLYTRAGVEYTTTE